MTAPPIVKLFRGHDPKSKTRRGPFWMTGLVQERITKLEPHKWRINPPGYACMGDSIPHTTTAFYDYGIEAHDGDLVQIHYDGGMVTKYLYRVADTWLTCCNWYCCPLSWLPGIKAIGVRTIEIHYDAWFPHIAHQIGEPEDKAWRQTLNAHPEVIKARDALLNRWSRH